MYHNDGNAEQARNEERFCCTVAAYIVATFDPNRYKPQPDPKRPLDLAALSSLNASGSVKIGALKVSNVKATNVRIEIKAAN